MYLMYADESGNTGSDLDNKEQPIFVLSGIFVETNKWHHINDYFNRKTKQFPTPKKSRWSCVLFEPDVGSMNET